MFDLISISEAIKRSYDSEGLLVDVRSEEVFKKGHLPMAVNLPFEEIMDEVVKTCAKVEPDCRILR